jgi:hypothetical protein
VSAERNRTAEARRKAARRRRVARAGRKARAKVVALTHRLGIHPPVRRAVRAIRSRRRTASIEPASPVAATVERLATARGPVVVGPLMEEVGFELLYWVPFLRWLARHHDLDTSRWIVVSRGGTRSWYADLAAGGYADVLDVWRPEELRAANEERWREVGSQKQRYESAVEDRLLAHLGEAGRLPATFEALHPSAMYETLWRLWKDPALEPEVRQRTRHVALPPPPLPDGLELPDDFVAVKWYFRPSLPDTPKNRARIREITRALAEGSPVVLLHGLPRLDDHPEADLDELPGVQAVLRDVAPARNLEVQSAIIARATAYVGTYGGMGYLPMVYGVPARLYASHRRHLKPVHIRAGIDAAAGLGVAHELLDLQEVERS